MSVLQIIDFLTMNPDARRRVVRILGEIEVGGRWIVRSCTFLRGVANQESVVPRNLPEGRFNGGGSNGLLEGLDVVAGV